jgi:quercetin dioxygenase-like cupin family protein
LNLAYFVYHVSEIATFRHEEGYEGRRLNGLLGGSVDKLGGSYAQVIEVQVRAGQRILSHWHTDREAIFYCLSGRGRFLLDGLAREVGPGDAMFQPVHAVHGADNPDGVDLRFIEVVLQAPEPSRVTTGEHCFTSVARATTSEHRGATLRSLFPPSTFGSQKIDWCGELHLGEGRSLAWYADPENEQTLLVLEGHGTAVLEDTTTDIRPGSILFIPAGFGHALTASRSLRLFGVQARAGREFVPELLRRGRASPG